MTTLPCGAAGEVLAGAVGGPDDGVPLWARCLGLPVSTCPGLSRTARASASSRHVLPGHVSSRWSSRSASSGGVAGLNSSLGSVQRSLSTQHRRQKRHISVQFSLTPSPCTRFCMCLCMCTWSSGWCRLVTFRLRFDSHCGSFANNLEQVANLQCGQVNSTSYPQRDWKWVVACGLRGEALVWLIGAVLCQLAATAGPTVRWRGQWMAA